MIATAIQMPPMRRPGSSSMARIVRQRQTGSPFLSAMTDPLDPTTQLPTPQPPPATPTLPTPVPTGPPATGWLVQEVPTNATKFCFACGAQIDARAEICPKCGVRQIPTGYGKSRAVAATLALFLGSFGIHKFYLGQVALGILYLLFFWTGIPGFIAWIEAIIYLATSDANWAQQHGGIVQRSNGAAIGCLWIIALFPLLAIVAIIALIFLGSQVSSILSVPH